MSWQNRLAVLLLPLWLAACGFEPMYAKNNHDTGSLMAGIKIDSMAGRDGQQFKANLEDRLNPNGVVPEKPLYRLKVTLKNSITPIGVARDGTVSRYNVYFYSQYVLYRNSDDKEVSSGDINYVDSYNNITNAYFSTYVSEQDAMKRGITELSEIYRQRLSVLLRQPKSS